MIVRSHASSRTPSVSSYLLRLKMHSELKLCELVRRCVLLQVNPLAPLFVPVQSGLTALDQAFWLLKHQLVGFCRGVSLLGDGRFSRPFGIRAVDLAMQEYEGTVTIFPAWSLKEMTQFLSNFDHTRTEQYFMDGERATWPHLPVIRSLCEVEFVLDRVAADLQLARAREARESMSTPLNTSTGGVSRGKLPSYISLTAYGNSSADDANVSNEDRIDHEPGSYGFGGLRVASAASMLNLAGMVMSDGSSTMHSAPSVGFAPIPMS